MKKHVLKTTTLLLLAMLWASPALLAQVNMSRYITLTVVDGADIKLELAADAGGTPVQIVSGANTYDITVGTTWTGTQTYTAGATTMTIYGNIRKFRCSSNNANLTALDPGHNTGLTTLYCYNNDLTSLDVSQNTALEWLYCYNNDLTSLDVSQNTALKELKCSDNDLTSLDVSQNTALKVLKCSDNDLTSLDISQNTALEMLWCWRNDLTSLDVSQNTALEDLRCSENNLTSLDVSQNTALKELICSENPFTTQAIDDIYCALADRTAVSEGSIYPAFRTYDTNHAAVLASNATNARNKNWKVQYLQNDTDIPTTGTYTCATVAVTGVSLDMATATITAGNTQQLTATVVPNNATNQNVTWSSSDNSIATVSNTGLVTAVAAGNATITVTTDDGGFTDQCAVTVTNATVAVTGVSLDINTATITAGNTQQLTATVAPANATNQAVTWSSSDNNIATVNATGLVTAVAAGNATITVTTDDGGFTDQCAVTVTASANISLSPTGHDYGNISVGASATQTFTLTNTGGTATEFEDLVISGTNASFFDYQDDYFLATVDIPAGGSVTIDIEYTPTATGSHTAVATFETAAGNFTANLSGNASVAVTGVSLDINTATITEGNTQQLTATVAPTNASNQNVTWSSSDNSIATVSATGLVTAVAAGNATITVTTVDGGFTDQCAVTVTAPANISLSPTGHDYGNVSVGASATQTFTLTNTGGTAAEFENLVISGTNASFFDYQNDYFLSTVDIPAGGSVTIDIEYTPTAAGSHTAVATFETAAGNFTANLSGNASVAVTGVSLDMNTATIARGNTQQLTATVAPTNASNQDITWSSSDNSIATVSTTGLVTAVAAGNATITVTTVDGGFTDQCAVTVTAPVYAIDIDNHDFGVIDLAATATQDFTISNTGDADLLINSMTVNGTNAAEFTHNAAMPLTIAPGNSHTFTVTFDPAGLGWRHAHIDIASNDGNHTVTLKGAATSNIPTVPVSNWAIILGVAIIIGGSLLRFVIKN